MNNRHYPVNKRKFFLNNKYIYFIADYFYRTKNFEERQNSNINNQLNYNINIIGTVSNISSNFQFPKQQQVNNSNNFSHLKRYSQKFEDIKNCSNKEKNLSTKKINNNKIYIINDDKYNLIKKNLLKSDYNISKSIPKLLIKSNKDNEDSFGNYNVNEDDCKNYINYNLMYNNMSDRSNKSDEGEPDPRINFEEISQINKSRPLTSYGGLNVRKKNLQNALENQKNRPCTSYNMNNND